jgi:hypothetical protein
MPCYEAGVRGEMQVDAVKGQSPVSQEEQEKIAKGMAASNKRRPVQ